MIRLNKLTLGYGRKILLQQVSMDFRQGELVALLGRNGTGKSTLLRTISGLNKAQGGAIFFSGRLLSSMNPADIARSVSLVSTERIRIPHFKCRDVIALGRSPYTDWLGKIKEADRKIIAQALQTMGMSDYAGKTMDCMSDGECQRIMIARALAQDTPTILLDEPTSFLDLPNRYELGILLRKLAHEQGKCIVFSTHELDIALNLCDKIALIENPDMHYSPVDVMIRSGHLERLFQNNAVAFDSRTQRVVLKK